MRLLAPPGQAANTANVEIIGFSIRYLTHRLRTQRSWLHSPTVVPRQAAFFDFATWVAMASISAGDRQS
jgi:hypothetical protein